ncbi:MAG: aldo/keto reductase [Defluviitaleaceae bacterium]|nr:aldo/keto reductase [Defluviitaleaceae bacterium]
MKYRKLGNSGIDVSVIGHGTWGLGNDYFGEIDEDAAVRSIHASLDGGVNLIDTAAAYGLNNDSEKLVGKAIKGRRDKVVVATKVGLLRTFGAYIRTLDPGVMRIELEKSLKNLGTDYIDLYQIHWPDYNNSLEGALKEMLKFKKEGKIRAIGVSNFSVEEMRQSVEIADISSAQPQLSLLSRGFIESGVIPFCEQNGVGVLTYGSLAGGILTGKITKRPAGDPKDHRAEFYPFYDEPMLSMVKELLVTLKTVADGHNASVAEASINWVLAQPGVTCALMGSSKPETAAANVKAADWELSAEELGVIEESYRKIFG